MVLFSQSCLDDHVNGDPQPCKVFETPSLARSSCLDAVFMQKTKIGRVALVHRRSVSTMRCERMLTCGILVVSHKRAGAASWVRHSGNPHPEWIQQCRVVSVKLRPPGRGSILGSEWDQKNRMLDASKESIPKRRTGVAAVVTQNLSLVFSTPK